MIFNMDEKEIFTVYDCEVGSMEDLLDEDDFDSSIMKDLESIPEDELNAINKELGFEEEEIDDTCLDDKFLGDDYN